jgi:hypothetical protein
MKREIVHMIVSPASVSPAPLEILTRCGRTIDIPLVFGGPSRYQITAQNGNEFLGTTDERFVTCKKCHSLLTGGMTHGSKRQSAARPVREVNSKNPVGRPKGGRLRPETDG